MRKKAFSLIELLIVISILGIMAAIVLPMFRDNIQQTKEAAAKDTLRVLRTVIETYAAKNNGIPPGYVDKDPTGLTSVVSFGIQLFGNTQYMNKMPENPFNEDLSITILNNSDAFPTVADGDSGWIYKPATKNIRLNTPGKDNQGVSYFDY